MVSFYILLAKMSEDIQIYLAAFLKNYICSKILVLQVSSGFRAAFESYKKSMCVSSGDQSEGHCVYIY